MNIPEWLPEKLDLARTSLSNIFTSLFEIARESPDPSTKNSALIFVNGSAISSGYNRCPGNLDLLSGPGWEEKPLKYKTVVHAEETAILGAALNGNKTKGGIMVALWAPCFHCAALMVEAKLFGLVVHKPLMDWRREGWSESIDEANQLLEKAGINVFAWDGRVNYEMTHRFGGQDWTPPFRGSGD